MPGRAGSGARAAQADAERAQRRREREQANGAERESSRTVLRRERVIVLPDGIDIEHAEPLLEAVREKVGKSTRAALADAWLVVREVQAPDARRAIEAHAGKPGTPDAKPGVYKAPPTQSWRGGAIYEAPPAPKVERRALDD